MRPSYFLQYFMRQPKSFVLSIHIFPSHLPNLKEEGWYYFLQLDFHHTPIKPDGKWPIHRRKDPIFGLASGANIISATSGARLFLFDIWSSSLQCVSLPQKNPDISKSQGRIQKEEAEETLARREPPHPCEFS